MLDSLLEIAQKLCAKYPFKLKGINEGSNKIILLMNEVEFSLPGTVAVALIRTQYKWPYDSPEPAYWFAPDGTKVYRSYNEYCMD